jgi:Tfp pilus assembly protein PilO
MSPTHFFITLSLLLATVLLVFAMRYASAVVQAKARLANDEAYRQLAEKAVAAQAANATALAAIDATLSEVKARLGAVEKVLKEVE